MSLQALAGLVGLNALYLGAGATFLWLVRGVTDWVDVLRFAGLAYVVGIVLTGSLWTFVLIADVPFSLGVVLAVPIALTGAFVVAGQRRGRRIPRGGRLPGGTPLLVTAVGIAASGVLLEGLFRMARLSGLYWFDGWSFWVPKAKAIYFFGALDEQFFAELPGASYPLLVPVLDAAAFHAMGGPDVVTLHAQYWLLAVGFVWAFAGLLAERVPPWILWPFVLLVLLAPRLGRRFQIAEADLWLDYLFVLAAVLVGVWLLEHERWRLVVATVLLSGTVLTKREGLLLATLLFAAALVTTARQWRARWPAIALSALAVAVVAAPWRLWYIAHDIEGEAGSQGLIQQDDLGGVWPAVRRALEVFWEPSYWNVIVPLFVGALVVGALARVGTLLAFFGTLTAFVLAGGMWATWVFSQTGTGLVLGGNFIIRYMGAAALLCVAATPLLLASAWPRERVDAGSPRARRRVGLAAAIVVVPLLVYPAVTMASGFPRFPTRDECVRPAVEGEPVDVVYGRFDSRVEAAELLERVLTVGFTGTETLFDACGRWKVVLEGVPSLEIARGVQEEAATVDLEPTLERGADG